MITINIQLVLFLNQVFQRPDLKYQELNKKMNNVFNGVPHIMPIPDGAPLEIPVVQMKSNNNKYNLNLAKNRIDFFLNLGQKISDENIEDFKIKSKNIVEYFNSTNKISRVGLLGQYFKETTKGVEIIDEKYFNNSMRSMNELQIRFNEKNLLNELPMNNISNISSVSGQIFNKDTEGVLVTKDINTDISSNTDKALSKKNIDNILDNYLGELHSRKIQELI